jgi:DNA topoisomerase-3
LTEDYRPTCDRRLAAIDDERKMFAECRIENKTVNVNKRTILNDRWISDHFAIIPAPQSPTNLCDGEYKIPNMILERFLWRFFPNREFDIIHRFGQIKEHSFQTEGKISVIRRWSKLMGEMNRKITVSRLPWLIVTESLDKPRLL